MEIRISNSHTRINFLYNGAFFYIQETFAFALKHSWFGFLYVFSQLQLREHKSPMIFPVQKHIHKAGWMMNFLKVYILLFLPVWCISFFSIQPRTFPPEGSAEEIKVSKATFWSGKIFALQWRQSRPRENQMAEQFFSV